MLNKTWFFILVVFLSGCTGDRPSRGWVREAQIGVAYPEFIFVDDDGVQRSLGNQLGDFTVLAFTRCDRDTHGPVSAKLREIIAENQRAPMVKIVGLDVHWFEGRCDHSQCHLVTNERNLESLCDSTGAVRRLYGVDATDRYVVIGPSRRIDLIVEAKDVETLRQRLGTWVRQLFDERSKELSQEYQPIGFLERV